MKLLIVDDNPLMRHTIRTIVSRYQDEVQECADGSSAISAYRTFIPDWVLMDIKMGQIGGIQATIDLKAKFPDARVAIVSQHGDQEFRDAAKAAGAEKYFLKDNLTAIRENLDETA
jgi:two-component system, NarL family, response regulator DegU